jgi:hypothetical protein
LRHNSGAATDDEPPSPTTPPSPGDDGGAAPTVFQFRAAATGLNGFRNILQVRFIIIVHF